MAACLAQVGLPRDSIVKLQSCHVTHTSASHTSICLPANGTKEEATAGVCGRGIGVTFYYSRASIMNACLAIIKCSGIPTSRKAGHTLHTHTHIHTHIQCSRARLRCADPEATRKWLLLPQGCCCGRCNKTFCNAMQCCSGATGTAIILHHATCGAKQTEILATLEPNNPNLTLACNLGLPACLRVQSSHAVKVVNK